MNRLFSFVGVLAFGLALNGSALAQGAMSSSSPMAMKSPAAATSSKKCAAGTTWVKGYTKKDGTKVKGYCRKG